MWMKTGRRNFLPASLPPLRICLAGRKHIDAIQITVETKNNECLRKLREDKKSTLILVGKMYDSLIDAATTQQEEFNSSNGNKMTSLKENLLLLNHMKLHMEPETVSQKDVENY